MKKPKDFVLQDYKKMDNMELLKYRTALMKAGLVLEDYLELLCSTYADINTELQSRINDLEVELELAQLDRENSNDPEYAHLLFIN